MVHRSRILHNNSIGSSTPRNSDSGSLLGQKDGVLHLSVTRAVAMPIVKEPEPELSPALPTASDFVFSSSSMDSSSEVMVLTI